MAKSEKLTLDHDRPLTEAECKAQQGKRAGAKFNGDFFLIETYSGRGLMRRDPKAKQHLLAPDVSDELIGTAILQSLKASRLISREQYGAFFNLERGAKTYEKWTLSLMRKYGYKNKQSLFRHMKSCSIRMVGERIIISPSIHEKLQAWGSTHGDDLKDVTIAADRDRTAIGKALRRAFDRCR